MAAPPNEKEIPFLSKQMSERAMDFDWTRGSGNRSGKSSLPKSLRIKIYKDPKETTKEFSGNSSSGLITGKDSENLNSDFKRTDSEITNTDRNFKDTSALSRTFSTGPKFNPSQKNKLSNLPSDSYLIERLMNIETSTVENKNKVQILNKENLERIIPNSNPNQSQSQSQSQSQMENWKLMHSISESSLEFSEQESRRNVSKEKFHVTLPYSVLTVIFLIILWGTFSLNNTSRLMSEMEIQVKILNNKMNDLHYLLSQTSASIPEPAPSQTPSQSQHESQHPQPHPYPYQDPSQTPPSFPMPSKHSSPEPPTEPNSLTKHPDSPLTLNPDEAEPSDARYRRLSLTLSIICIFVLLLLWMYMDAFHRLFCSVRGRRITEEDVLFSKRVAYRVDVLFSSSPWMKPLALLAATFALILLGGFLFYGVDGKLDPKDRLSLLESMWASWTFTADPGNHANITGFWPRLVSLVISFGGFLIFAVLLGLISEAIYERVDSLRKGKSEVVERNHTLILGWSHKLGFILKEIAIANESLHGGVMVVLSERSKEDMESDLARLELNLRGSSVICRSGSPLLLADLRKVSIATARSIIVLAEVDNADQSDARALRIVQSIMGLKDIMRKDAHIVVEVSDVENHNLIKTVGKTKEKSWVETVVAHDMIGRLLIQCARLPGLAEIWENLLGFDKCEFYRKKWCQLDGKTFGEVLISFPDAIPFGVQMASDGRIFLNPPDNYVLKHGDEILVVAEDDDTYKPVPAPRTRPSALPDQKLYPRQPEHILFCGWRRDMDDMISVLDSSLAKGSEIWIFSEISIKERTEQLTEGCIMEDDLNNVKICHRLGNSVIRRNLEGLPLQCFDSIIILADANPEENTSGMDADSKTLATLLLIRDIQFKRAPESQRHDLLGSNSFLRPSWQKRCVIVSEILDSRTRSLVSKLNISDYVLSNELVSKALAMVSEDREVNRILEELFQVDGNELYIKSARFYIYNKEELSFYDIMVRARKRMEIVIGYWLPNQKPLINPPHKSTVVSWSIETKFIIFALEE